MKKRSIALALCCSLVASPVWAKTFVGVLYPLFGPMAAIGLVQLADEDESFVCSLPRPEVPELGIIAAKTDVLVLEPSTRLGCECDHIVERG